MAGVIEGFYGQPWAQSQRMLLFDWMAAWGLNTYMYGPKDDLKQRALWRELYTEAEGQALQEVIQACKQRDLRFIYALSPGLDIRYSSQADQQCLLRKLEQLAGFGCRDFTLLFDDIPDRMHREDVQRWETLASAQSHVANLVLTRLEERFATVSVFFCPTPYCGRMAKVNLGGPDYLATLGRELLPQIPVFWTGPEIVSDQIPVDHLSWLQELIRRKPVIWDNLHANDYDGRRFYCGPYAGRPVELRGMVTGVLSNPNNEFPLNYVPLRTMAEWVHCQNGYDPREAYLSAMREWLQAFRSVRNSPEFEELVAFGDCYYLPYQEGPEAATLMRMLGQILRSNADDPDVLRGSFKVRSGKLKDFCGRISELLDRSLFYALSRRAWELREELELIERYLERRFNRVQTGTGPTSDYHLPGTYRGGMVAKLQRMLVQNSDGTFTPYSGILAEEQERACPPSNL